MISRASSSVRGRGAVTPPHVPYFAPTSPNISWLRPERLPCELASRRRNELPSAAPFAARAGHRVVGDGAAGEVCMKTTTRLATLADAGAMARIYNEGIEDRIATFETELRTTEQIEA